MSSRVEKRLQEIEREMRSERQSVSDRRPEQRFIMSDELQEALRLREARDLETEEAVKNKLLRSESEKTKMEAELERARRQLDQSEGGRGALQQQVEEMRVQLLRTEKERMDLQREISQLTTQPRATRMDREERGAGLGTDCWRRGWSSYELRVFHWRLLADGGE